jgi:hypothetical protein
LAGAGWTGPAWQVLVGVTVGWTAPVAVGNLIGPELHPETSNKANKKNNNLFI